jgi:hypothetical protein
LIFINGIKRARFNFHQMADFCTFAEFMWQPISSAPFGRDLELAVLDADGAHALVFPCKRVPGGWINAATKRWIDVRPTHWREWVPKDLM